jgi:branched-chain amino acid transport system permease protein
MDDFLSIGIWVLLQAVVSGLLMGGIYALAAIGLTLIFGVMKIINFAHGSFMMLGMYTSYWLFVWFGLHPYYSLAVSFIVLFLVGGLIQRFLISRIEHTEAQNVLLITLGLSLILDNLAAFLWTADYRTVRPTIFAGTAFIGEIMVSIPKLMAFIFSLFLTLGLYLFLKKTDTGKSIRAIADDIEGSRSVGINIRRISFICFGIGSGVIGAAGSMITPFFPVSPTVGSVFVNTAFIVVVLGGLGSFWGALVGGLIVGLAESIEATYHPGAMQQFVTYIIFILTLLFRPTGLFGGKSA